MDDTLKPQLIQALQDTIRLKKEVWRLTDLLGNPNLAEHNINIPSRDYEIEQIQNQLVELTGVP